MRTRDNIRLICSTEDFRPAPVRQRGNLTAAAQEIEDIAVICVAGSGILPPPAHLERYARGSISERAQLAREDLAKLGEVFKRFWGIACFEGQAFLDAGRKMLDEIVADSLLTEEQIAEIGFRELFASL
jgi:hypothetical protein